MYTGFSRVIYSTPHGSVILVSLETRLVSYETRLVSLETRLVSRETRGGKLRVSGTVRSIMWVCIVFLSVVETVQCSWLAFVLGCGYCLTSLNHLFYVIW